MTVVETIAQLVPTGTWKIDPAHSSVEFGVKHTGVATVRGRFGDVLYFFLFLGSMTAGILLALEGGKLWALYLDPTAHDPDRPRRDRKGRRLWVKQAWRWILRRAEGRKLAFPSGPQLTRSPALPSRAQRSSAGSAASILGTSPASSTIRRSRMARTCRYVATS